MNEMSTDVDKLASNFIPVVHIHIGTLLIHVRFRAFSS
jgi:hypothetical protein